MWVGDVVAERFAIERPAGSGGMGSVFRALDRHTGAPVAVKVMDGTAVVDRFYREARILAQLRHPAIVSYVAHGEAPNGVPYLVMEWLEGEDLASRLRRGPLSVAQSLVLVERTAEALGLAHTRGVVHRDIKPSNLMLVGGEPEQVKVVDFGVARTRLASQTRTGTGAMIGTVGYMSPEQAMGDADVDAATDVFALGCVLFECLTGRAAFAAEHAVAVLAKVLKAEPPPASELAQGVPNAVDGLVRAMLAKERAERLSDAHAVLAALEALEVRGVPTTNVSKARVADARGRDDHGTERRPPYTGPAITESEQRFVSIILARLESAITAMIEVLAPFTAGAVELADGTVLVTLTERAGGGDAASQGAACALALLQRFPDASLALSTGRGARTGQSIFGPVIEQAASLLHRARGASGIFVDRATTTFLEGRYDFTPEAPQRLLGRRPAERPRLLLGKPTPCVGREKDLAILEAVFDECVTEPVARAVVVTAAPGIGKSRLRLELVARLERRGARVLTARGDIARSGWPLSLARQLLREAAGIGETTPAEALEAELRAWTAERFETDDVKRMGDFVCELAGSAVAEPGPHLRAARNDPVMMSSQLRWLFQSWIERETRGAPLIIALEDLHWGDAPSIEYLTTALERLSDSALLLLGFARPEVEESFPRLWPQAQRIPLQPLTRRAAEILIQATLGDGVNAALRERLVERAGGNAFYLEELVRAAAEGDPETLPETVLATVELRLSRLDSAARRVLRAASLFGERFWDRAVAEVLAGDAAPPGLPTWLGGLADAELIQRESGSRFSPAQEYSFRHALVREAAYAMLTESDRRAGHLGAATWLEAAQEKDALAIAGHFELGGAPERAVPWIVQGVREAVRAGDWQRVRSLVERGLRSGAGGPDLGCLRHAQAHLSIIDEGRFDRALELRREAMQLLPVASPLWLECAAIRVIAAVKAGRHEHIVETLQALTSPGVEPQPMGPYAQALCWLIFGLVQSGQRALAESCLGQLERTALKDARHDPVFEGYLCLARALDWFHDDPGANLRSARRGYACLDFENSPFWLDGALYFGPALANVGHFDEALQLLRELERRATHPGFSLWARVWSAWSMVVAGRLEDTLQTAAPLVDAPDAAAASQARLAIACARAALGDLDDAERAAKEFPSERWPMTGITALTLRADIRLARVDPKNALALLDEARSRAEKGCWAFESSRMLRLRSLALAALGDANGARDVIVEARDRLFQIAKSFDDPKTSDAWLAIPEHVETLRLARELLE